VLLCLKVGADSALDFSSKITAQIGSPHTEITLEPDVQYDFKTGAGGKEVPGSQKIASVGLTVTTKIVKVRFGTGRPNEKHKQAIDQMVAAIQAHEEQHRAIVVAEATAALTKAQKLVGTSKVKEAYKILNGVDCAAAKKHEALDAKEGLLTASENADGDVTISKSASGAKYPCGAAANAP
jgi:predicted secreted Zn-dependent protease